MFSAAFSQKKNIKRRKSVTAEINFINEQKTPGRKRVVVFNAQNGTFRKKRYSPQIEWRG